MWGGRSCRLPPPQALPMRRADGKTVPVDTTVSGRMRLAVVTTMSAPPEYQGVQTKVKTQETRLKSRVPSRARCTNACRETCGKHLFHNGIINRPFTSACDNRHICRNIPPARLVRKSFGKSTLTGAP